MEETNKELEYIFLPVWRKGHGNGNTVRLYAFQERVTLAIRYAKIR